MASDSIYLLSSRIGRLYIGVTRNLDLRVTQYKERVLEGFTTREKQCLNKGSRDHQVRTQRDPVSGLGGRKAAGSMGTISTVGSFDSAPKSPLFAMSLQSASLRMTALWGVKYNWSDIQKTLKGRKSHRLSG
jgi:hypothetical protein